MASTPTHRRPVGPSWTGRPLSAAALRELRRRRLIAAYRRRTEARLAAFRA